MSDYAPINSIQRLIDIKRSCVAISNSFSTDVEVLKDFYAPGDIRIYALEELDVAHASEIAREAYTGPRCIAIFAFVYSVLSQNMLLKLLEEPPEGLIFMLFVSSRNKLLKTIYSRLPCFDIRKKADIEPLDLDITRLNIPMAYEYIIRLEKENLSAEAGREIVERLLKSVAISGIELSEFDLERFDLAIKALHAKQSAHLAILPLLLSLVRK